jgi:hypothetical protein
MRDVSVTLDELSEKTAATTNRETGSAALQSVQVQNLNLELYAQSQQDPSWFPSVNISADHAYEVASEFESLFGVVARNESGVVIEGHVSLAPEAVEDYQQASVFIVNTAPDELDDCDMMPRLASRAKAVAEHETERDL